MIVKDIMKTDVGACTTTDDVAVAVGIMQRRRCGFVPVIDSHGAVVGVVTDRDLCVLIARNRSEHIAVTDAMSRPVFSCLPDDSVKVALTTMARHRIRRLPVLDEHGHLCGVLSIDDILQTPHRRGSPTPEQIVNALRDICSPRPVEIAAV